MTTDTPCRHCRQPLTPEASTCPHCGQAVDPKDTALPAAPPFRRSTSAPTEMTQIIELPPGGFLPPPPPAPHADMPPPEKTDRKSVALALALGLLAGALVLLLLAGIVRSRQGAPVPAGIARP